MLTNYAMRIILVVVNSSALHRVAIAGRFIFYLTECFRGYLWHLVIFIITRNRR